MPHPSHYSRFYHPNNIGWAVQIIKLLNMYFTPIPCYLAPLRRTYLPQKLPAFYGTRKFITAFTSSHHQSLSLARSIQSIPPHSISWRSILILSSHLRLDLQRGFVLQFSPPKPCIHLPSPPYMLHAPPVSFFSISSPDQYWVSRTDH